MTIETIGRHRDGTRFPVRVIATPDPTNDGRMIATVEDIAARVLSEFHLSMPPQEPRIQPLTESEMAVLRLVARGVENEHIAQLPCMPCDRAGSRWTSRPHGPRKRRRTASLPPSPQ